MAKFHLAHLDSTRSTLSSESRRVCRAVLFNMADDEEAVVLACTSFVVCALCVHVNNKENRQHAVTARESQKRETSAQSCAHLSSK